MSASARLPLRTSKHREGDASDRHDAAFTVVAVIGVASGAAVGLIAGPIGCLMGAALGGAAGLLAGRSMGRAGGHAAARDRELDAQIGVSCGDLGAAPVSVPASSTAAWNLDALDDDGQPSVPPADDDG